MFDPTVPKRFPCLFQVSIFTGLPRVQLVVVRHRRHIRTDRSCCCVVLRFVLVAVSVDVGQDAGTGGWTVMCWQQLGSDKLQQSIIIITTNGSPGQEGETRLTCMGSAKCIRNFSGKTWRKDTTVSSRKAHGQAVAYSTHTESSRGALAQLFFLNLFKHVQSTNDKIALLWQQASFRGMPRCLSGQWRKHGRRHQQTHSHTNKPTLFLTSDDRDLISSGPSVSLPVRYCQPNCAVLLKYRREAAGRAHTFDGPMV